MGILPYYHNDAFCRIVIVGSPQRIVRYACIRPHELSITNKPEVGCYLFGWFTSPLYDELSPRRLHKLALFRCELPLKYLELAGFSFRNCGTWKFRE